MTLEHIHPVADFLAMVRRSIADKQDTIVFFQIPETLRILKDCAFEDIYYEHCSYFTPGTLARLFRNNGFEVIDIETEYQGQYLTIEAIPREFSVDRRAAEAMPIEESIEELTELIKSFKDRSREKISAWNSRFEAFAEHEKKIVLWGSGSKGVSFLTTLESMDVIEYVVDINPYRQGYYMSGTGQEIISPERLVETKPDVVIVMNSVYVEEINQSLQDLGLSPEVVALD